MSVNNDWKGSVIKRKPARMNAFWLAVYGWRQPPAIFLYGLPESLRQ